MLRLTLVLNSGPSLDCQLTDGIHYSEIADETCVFTSIYKYSNFFSVKVMNELGKLFDTAGWELCLCQASKSLFHRVWSWTLRSQHPWSFHALPRAPLVRTGIKISVLWSIRWDSGMRISTRMGWVVPPNGLSLGWPCAAQGPKFKILLRRSSFHRPTEYTCQVSSTSAQQSRNLMVLKMLTPRHGRTHGHSSQVNDVPRTQTGTASMSVLHITLILFHVKFRSASGSDQVSSVIILKFLIFPKPIKSVFECINRRSLDNSVW